MMRKINELIVVRSFYNILIKCCPNNSEEWNVYDDLANYLRKILMVDCYCWISINMETKMVDDIMDKCLEKLT